mmetsp:Transcript_1513/g.2613  ORF Transcript_1513/g.2613 Transcript_1513/m.2613 type:complete len:204 (+) Transcript_1513:303-914(+)
MAKRYAIKYNPPSVVLEYKHATKIRLRTVKLLDLTADSDVEQLTSKVIRSFPRALDASTINHEQVKRLVQRLKDHVQKGTEGAKESLRASPEKVEPEEFVLEEPEKPEEPEEAEELEEEDAEELVLDGGGGVAIDLNDPNLDLNKVSIVDLKAAKAKMDEEFIKHRKLPGEEGFQYDVQVDFQFAEGVGDWDSEGDDSGFDSS